jgi:hypothetical protein
MRIREGREAGYQSHCENSKQIFTEKELRGHSPNVYIHVSVSDLYIPTIFLPILLQEICGPILGYVPLTDTNVEIGTEAAQLPEKDYINGFSLQYDGYYSSLSSLTDRGNILKNLKHSVFL